MQIKNRITDRDNYRYEVVNIWDINRPLLLVVGLNPSGKSSTARLGTTATKLRELAKQNGFGGMLLMNVCAWKCCKPRDLRKVGDPFGSENLRRLAGKIRRPRVGGILLHWGYGIKYVSDDRYFDVIYRLLQLSEKRIYTLGLTKNRHPKHALTAAYSAWRRQPAPL